MAMRRSNIDKVRENLRLQQVYNVFLHYGWDFLFQQWEIVDTFRHMMQQWVWHLPEEVVDVPVPVKVRLMLEELGPTYVKMGQIVSSQASVIPAEWEAELEKLQSDVPPFPSSQAREIIIEELGAPPEELFATFEANPFAAASTAQVHRAVLHSGELVVVKVQRPNVRTQMRADLGIMQNAVRVVSSRSEYVRTIDLRGMVDEFSKNVLVELDYGGEAYNAFRLNDNMANIEGVRLPKVYGTLSTSKVLTMEYVQGVKISDIDAIDAAGLSRGLLSEKLLRAMSKQLFIDGFFHADPHPGNIFVNLESGDIIFIDLGMVGELDLQKRLNLVQLLFALQQQDVKGLAQIMLSLSSPFMGEIDEKAYYRDFERTVGRYMYGGATVDIGESVNVMFELLRNHGLRLDSSLTLAIKALLQIESAGRLLNPEGGFINQGTAMVKEMAVEEITADKVAEVVKDQLTMSAREVFKRIPSLQEATMSWLDQYQKGRFEVHLDFSQLTPEVNKINRMGRLAVIAIVLVGMIIGSAIATAAIGFSQAEGELWKFVFRLAYIGYVFAMIVAILLVIGLLWHWFKGER